MEREESDQLPEEQPSGAVPDDDDSTESRDDAQEQGGVPGEGGTNTGNPGAAGAED
jgi:hypothetical protein